MISRMRKIAARTGDPNMYPDAVTHTGGGRGGGGGARVHGRGACGRDGGGEAMYAEFGGRRVRLRIRVLRAIIDALSTAPSG